MNYTKLIKEVKEKHLYSIEFAEKSMKIKAQIGNRTGSQFEIEFDDFMRIHNIKFIAGGYNEPLTIKGHINDVLDLIYNAR